MAESVNVNVTTSDVKPGWKTTEFWLSVVTSLGVLLNQSGILGALQIPIDGVATIAGVIATYVASRAWTKASSSNGKS